MFIHEFVFVLKTFISGVKKKINIIATIIKGNDFINVIS